MADDRTSTADEAENVPPLRLGTLGAGAGSTAAKAEQARLEREATHGSGNRAERRARSRA